MEGLLKEIKRIYNLNFTDDIKVEWSEIVKALLRNTKINIYRNTETNEVIGFIMYTPLIYTRCVYIDYFCIDKKYQGCGLGGIILKNFIHIQEKNNIKILLDCKTNLANFYGKYGFKKLGLLRYRNIDLAIMATGKVNYRRFYSVKSDYFCLS